MVNTVLLNELIDASGLKREYIAQRVGISRQALYSKIQGESQFTVKEVAILSEVLGIKRLSDRDRVFFYGLRVSEMETAHTHAQDAPQRHTSHLKRLEDN